MKTDIDIKDEVYKHIKGSALEQAVNGKLSKTKRPNGSGREDIVISILDNNGSGQMQNAFVNVNIYVSDKTRNGQPEEDTIRLRELCKLSSETLLAGRGESYRFTLDKQRVLEVNGKAEHFINNKLFFEINNE